MLGLEEGHASACIQLVQMITFQNDRNRWKVAPLGHGVVWWMHLLTSSSVSGR